MMSSPVSKVYTRNALDHETIKDSFSPQLLQQMFVLQQNKCQFAGGGWTVFQKRYNGAVDFFRAWDDYKRGFGNLNGEFWLGLDKIHRLTARSSNKLRVDLEDIHGKTAFAEYSSFSVASERAKYLLSLGGYSGETDLI